MSAPSTYVHILSTDVNALVDFIEDAESSFMELGIAPDVNRPTDLKLTDAREWAETRPATATGEGWLPYLTRDFLSTIDATPPATLQYAGVDGMAVVGRVLRETTGSPPGVALQSHTYTNAPTDYTVYQYNTTAEEFTKVAHGTHE